MRQPVPVWKRLLRQLVPRRGELTCCWYHGVDWHVVTRVAVHHLDRLQAEGVTDLDELQHHATERSGHELTDDQQLALVSLFIEPIQLAGEGDDGDRYIGGRHRAQAMLDAGVRHVPVLRTRVSW